MRNAYEITAGMFMLVLGAVTLTVVTLEWISGCGETYYKADGTWETGECIVLPIEKRKGER